MRRPIPGTRPPAPAVPDAPEPGGGDSDAVTVPAEGDERPGEPGRRGRSALAGHGGEHDHAHGAPARPTQRRDGRREARPGGGDVVDDENAPAGHPR